MPRAALSRWPNMQGRPLLYQSCLYRMYRCLPAIIDNLYPAVETAQEALGKDSFSVITIGFDTRHDTPERMVSFARSRGIDLPNWSFLAGSAETVKQLTDTIGFTIVPSAGGFDHMAQVSIIDGKGQIYQQVYGGIFDAPAIVEPLKDLVFDRSRSVFSVGGIVDRVKFFCTVYNPNTGRYYFNYSLFIGIAIALACLGTILGWLIREFRGSDGPGQGVA